MNSGDAGHAAPFGFFFNYCAPALKAG